MAQLKNLLVEGDSRLIGDVNANSNVTASKFIKSGGTSSQFLKADGSVDSTVYTTNTGTVTSVSLSAGTGLSITGTNPITSSGTVTISHKNSGVTAQSTQAVYPIKFDAQGHIIGAGSAVTIPTVNNATLTIQKNGTSVGTFTANASSNVTANVTVPECIDISGGLTAAIKTKVQNNPNCIFKYDPDGSGCYYYIPQYGEGINDLPNYYQCFEGDTHLFRYLVIDWDELSIEENTINYLTDGYGLTCCQLTTYSALKTKRDNSQLVPGQQYIITDFVTTTTQADTQSARHQFDIIVVADSVNKLNENARACLHSGDTYFANSDLASWEIKYEIDESSTLLASIHSNGYFIIDGLPGCYSRSSSYDMTIMHSHLYAWTNGSNVVYSYDEYNNPDSDDYFEFYSDFFVDYSDTFYITSVNGNTIHANNYDGEDITFTRNSQSDFTFNGTNYYNWDNGDYYDCYTTSSSPSIGDNLYVGTWCDASGYYDASVYNNPSTSSQISAYRGIITYMKDEFGNECPYDFKNIQFKRYKISSTTKPISNWLIGRYYGISGGYGYSINQNDSKYYYTFSYGLASIVDNTLNGNSHHNIIPSNNGGTWNNIVFIDKNCYGNSFGVRNYNMTFLYGCYNNTFGNYCHDSILGSSCYNNIFGSSCYNNIFGNSCYANIFGNNCTTNTFGGGCYNNIFGNNCIVNSFGNNCQSNTFDIICSYNTFGNNCTYNTFGILSTSNTFGDYCGHNTFGNDCNYNTFGTGCYANTFGNDCDYIIFGDRLNASTSQTKSYIRYVMVENGVQYVNLYCTGTTSSGNYCQSIKVCSGIKGTSSSNRKQLNITSNIGKNTYLVFDPGTEVTYAQLKELRDRGNLTPGREYRITDFVTTTTQTDTQSANHPFDIIVVADTNDKLNENARACLHSGDTYFSSVKIESWELKYCLDNDTTRFAWADSTNGKGVIYYMKDEWGNECPYDFKNIQFARWQYSNPIVEQNNQTYYEDEYEAYWQDNWTTVSSGSYAYGFKDIQTGYYGFRNSGGIYGFYITYNSDGEEYNKYRIRYTVSSTPTYVYTFGTTLDPTVGGKVVKNNVIKEKYTSNILSLNNIVFLNTSTSSTCYGNTFGLDCHSNTFGNGCSFNTFGSSSYNNTFGYTLLYNTFGDNFRYNTFGYNCNYNTFGNNCTESTFGYSFRYNTLGTYCTYNTFAYSCNDNTFGNSCSYNIFDNNCTDIAFGNSCNNNTFGSSCNNNTFGERCDNNTFGNSCYDNTFGSGCHDNTFGTHCYSNTFGSECASNTFGTYCYFNTFGSECYSNTFGTYCASNTFGNSCQYIKFGNSSGTKSYYRYIIVENGNKRIYLYCSATISTSYYYQNVKICQGVNNSTSYKTITDSNRAQAYQTEYKSQNSIVNLI